MGLVERLDHDVDSLNQDELEELLFGSEVVINRPCLHSGGRSDFSHCGFCVSGSQKKMSTLVKKSQLSSGPHWYR